MCFEVSAFWSISDVTPTLRYENNLHNIYLLPPSNFLNDPSKLELFTSFLVKLQGSCLITSKLELFTSFFFSVLNAFLLNDVLVLKSSSLDLTEAMLPLADIDRTNQFEQ